ncbi:hypothetical protein E4U40_002460, partial [Claviceps sp. LM458 group G5]
MPFAGPTLDGMPIGYRRTDHGGGPWTRDCLVVESIFGFWEGAGDRTRFQGRLAIVETLPR